MTVSIVIAVKDDNPNLRQCIEACLELDYKDFEIIILPDTQISITYPKTVIIPTGDLTPPKKRDISISKAKGEILAFIDDDAYPAGDWLSKALIHFDNPDIAAVGGPAVTPFSDSLLEKASGLVYSSRLVSGPYIYRYLPVREAFVDDYPSCNFLVRKSVMADAGGFDTKFWPGEDTFLCLKIVSNLGKKIIYDPKVLVFHHRRRMFRGHLKQVANYGLHRGYFVKRFPGNSLKISYFLPSLLVFGLITGYLFQVYFPALVIPYFLCVFFYLAVVFMESINKDFPLNFLVFWGIILSHIVYGLYFIKGLFSRKLKEE